MTEDNPTGGLARIERQLERMEQDLRNTATRSDLADLRKEVVQNAVLEPQLGILRNQIAQIEKRQDEIEKEQVSRSERFWARIGPIVAIIALLLSFLQFFSHVQFR